jgi:hypothetical protein
MLRKVPPVVWKILGVLFTSVLAPVGIRHLDDTSPEPTPAEPIPALTSVVPLQELSPSTTRILAKGSGSTPEAAFQNAIDDALRQAVAAEVSAIDWQWHSQTYLASLRQNGTGVLRSWHEVSSVSEHHPLGRVFHSEVAVDVDLEALREHLHSASPVARR